MAVLFFLSSLLCGGDVARLGDPAFAVRQAAHERLKSLGWLAYPALRGGLADPLPERAWRCDELLTRLDGGWSRLLDAEAVAQGREPLPDAADDAFLKLVCRRVDALGGWRTADSWKWAQATPYFHGSLRADVGHAIRCAAANRQLGLFFPLVPLGTK